MRHGVSSGRRRRVRVHGRGAAAAARRAPGPRRRPRHRRQQRRRDRRLAVSRRSRAAYPGLDLRARSTPAQWPGSTSCSSPAPRRVPELAPHVIDDVAAPRGPRRRLPAAGGRRTSSGTAARTPRPSSSTASRYGLLELFRDTHRAPSTTSRSPGCYPTAAPLALAPLFAAGLVEPHVIVDAMSGVSGAGRGLKHGEPLLRGRRERRRLRAADAPSHRRDGAGAEPRRRRPPVQVLFTPHLVPMVRGIHATCHARAAASGLVTASLLAHLPRVLRR